MTNKFILNLENVDSEDSFHDLAYSVFEFPAYYGRNPDAFWDCITDIVGRTDVEVINLGQVPQSIRPAIDCYVQLMRKYEGNTRGEFKVVIKE